MTLSPSLHLSAWAVAAFFMLVITVLSLLQAPNEAAFSRVLDAGVRSPAPALCRLALTSDQEELEEALERRTLIVASAGPDNRC